MSGREHQWTVRALAAIIAGLLSAAVLGATTVERRPPAPVGSVGAAGLGLEGVPDERTASRSTEMTVAPPVISSSSTLPLRASTTTTAGLRTSAPSTTSPPSTNVSAPPVGTPSSRPTTTVPRVPRVSAWSADRDGISVRLRMRPSEPVAGEAVTFSVEFDPVDSCCIAHLSFGDDSATPLPVDASCTHTSDPVRASTTHTYASAGAYQVRLITATVPCGPFTGPPIIRGANITACVVIGTVPASKADCG